MGEKISSYHHQPERVRIVLLIRELICHAALFAFRIASLTSRRVFRSIDHSSDEVKAYKDWEGNILKQLQAMQNGVTTPMKFWRFDSKKDRFFPEVWINGKVGTPVFLNNTIHFILNLRSWLNILQRWIFVPKTT